MSRSVKEWIGKNDDAAIPRRVKLRIISRYAERCPQCARQLRAGHIAFDHIKALINGGEHRESNLQPLCDVPCHQEKTCADVAIKSKTYRVRSKHLGLRKRSSFQTNRDGKYIKHMDGSVSRRA